MGATNGKLGRGENNREVRGQRIGRIQAERRTLFLATLGLVRGQLVALAGASLPPCTVTFIRVAPGCGLDPEENLPGSLKAVKDELANILGVDDRDPRITWKYEQERGEWGVWVHILATLKGPEVVAPKASRSTSRRKHSAGPKKKAPLAVRRGLDRKVAAFLGAKPAFTPPPRRSP